MRKHCLGFSKICLSKPTNTTRQWSRRSALRDGRRRLRKRWMNPPSNGTEPAFGKAHAPKREKHHWPATPIACVLVVGISIVFVRSEFNETANQPASPLIAGWDDLISCSYTVSFDGTKQLELFEDRRVTLSAVGDDKIDKIAEGQWSFDENAKRYTIAVGGSTNSYSIVSLPLPPVVSCVLITGTINAADLRASWFSIPIDDAGDDRERH